ncbi:MAG: hypothetical protein ACTTJH_06070 [Bacteroidales bacterium]
MVEKKILLTSLILAFLGFCFTACNQEEEVKDLRKKGNSTENPFEYVGVEHNNLLDVFANQLRDSIHFSDWDIYRFDVANDDLNSSEYTFANFSADMSTIDAVVPDFLYSDPVVYRRFSNSEIVYSYMLRLREILIGAINSEYPLTPNEFTQSVCGIEDEVIGLYSNTTDVNVVRDYACVLGALAIAKYSYLYWYSATFDKNHLWYKIVNNRINTKSVKGLCRWLRAVVEAAITDVSGFVQEAVESATPTTIIGPDGVAVPAITIDAGKAVKQGARASKHVYKDRMDDDTVLEQ